jgi:hypothetical protein
MKLLHSFGWYWFGVSIANVYLMDYGIDECSMGEFNATIVVLHDGHSDVVSWVTLVFNVQACGRNLTNTIS